jgi:hypothetical protein
LAPPAPIGQLWFLEPTLHDSRGPYALRPMLRCGLPLGLVVLCACVAEDPSGPPVLLVTVAGAGSPALANVLPSGQAWLLEADGRRSTAELLGALITGAEPPPLSPAGRLHLPGTALTLAERFSALGFETAGAFADLELDEALGLGQGLLHTSDGPLLASLAPSDPLGAAVAEIAGFVAAKLPRPMEDAPFAWLHLDLRGRTAEEARATFDGAWGTLAEATVAAPDCVRFALALPTAELPGAVLRVAPGEPGAAGTAPLSLLAVADLIYAAARRSEGH